MLFLPRLRAAKTARQLTEVFGGYRPQPRIAEGELFAMQNLTSDCYPLLASRAPRGEICTLTAPSGLLGGDKPVWVDGQTVYYDFAPIANLTVSSDAAMQPKQLVRMGAFVCIFPDRVYFNTANLTDCGFMESQFSAQYVTVAYSLCKPDGTEFESTPSVNTQPPTTPVNGALWVDSSVQPHTLKQYNGADSCWELVPSVSVKLSLTGIGAPFQVGDGVRISGLSDPPAPLHWRPSDLPEGKRVISACGADYIVVRGMIDEPYSAQSDTLTVKRAMPDMDFVVECQNRLWGCKYGIVDGRQVNELYCCALGDFKNWEQYQGLSTDSWRASCGTDGAFTGAITVGDNPLFFKKNGLHKVFVSANGAHAVTQSACTGVSDAVGCNSLAIVGSALFYMSEHGVMCYDGTQPRCVSTCFGTKRFYARAAAGLGDKYYLSVSDADEKPLLLVYDAARGLWHCEDDANLTHLANADNRLLAVQEQTAQSKLLCLNDADYVRVTQREKAVAWSATSGIIGYRTVERQYVGRFTLRLRLPVGAHADLFLEYDSSGSWEHLGHLRGRGTASFSLPVRPRRCDHFRWRLEGSGEVRVYSIAKNLEQGSDLL